MMRALLPSLLLLGACGGAPASPTAVSLEVDYDNSGVATMSVNGAAGTVARRFGPYDVKANDLPSGGTIGLVFDPSDAGGSMVCVQSRASDGKAKDSGCTMFDIRAGEITTARVVLVRHED